MSDPRPGAGAEATERAEAARKALLAWYDAQARDLPWRARPGAPPPPAWEVLVSEAMLQQTTAATVAARFAAFLARFPSPAAMAAASEEEVFAAWSGLGYYARARRLRAAAAALAGRGSPPRGAAAWAELPGVGPYTAAAVASIVDGEAVAAVDTNLLRVVARWGALAGSAGGAPLRREVGRLAVGLLDPGRPGDGNQALMDVGALHCLPRAPRCPGCPLAPTCRAFAEGRQEELPRREGGAQPDAGVPGAARRPARGRGPLERRDLALAILRRHPATGAAEVLLWRRETAAVYRGMWELPTWREGEARGGAGPRDRDALMVRSALAWLAAAAGWAPRREASRLGCGAVVATVRHAITVYRVTLDLLVVTGAEGLAGDLDASAPGPGTDLAWRWVDLSGAAEVVPATPQRRLLAKGRAALEQAVEAQPGRARGGARSGRGSAGAA